MGGCDEGDTAGEGNLEGERVSTMDPAFLRPGTEVDGWRVVSRRGHGSYGAVYRVEKAGQETAGAFALKLALHPRDERFEREGELLSRVSHPHVPRLYARGEWQAPGGGCLPYLVMEWVEGVGLYEWAQRQALTSRQVLRLLAQVARALEATHAVGGVHRDVKGENVLVDGEGRAVLVDFGSCTYRGARKLTRPSVPPGTPQYWSPEALRFQWRFRRHVTAHYEAGPGDDVYALGVMSYRLVTDTYPLALEEAGLEEDWQAPRERVSPEAVVRMSPELAALIGRMLSNRPEARGSAEELAEVLEHAAEKLGRRADRPITPHQDRASIQRAAQSGLTRRWMTWLAGLTVAALGVFLAANAWKAVELARKRRDGGTEAGGGAALAEAVRTMSEDANQLKSKQGGIGLEMPKKPLPGQRRPPCRKYEVEINGGCWGLLGNLSPPCGEGAYEWKNECYWPSLSPGRQGTSEQP